MDISTYKDTIEKASGRALATTGPNGINVAALSMARVKDSEVWLFNFFMRKTVENIEAEPEVALSCWTGLEGIQMKGEVEYVTEGDRFKEAVEWVAGENPDRVVKGLLVFTPSEIYDLSAGADAGKPIA